jgi:hypothetical protein
MVGMSDRIDENIKSLSRVRDALLGSSTGTQSGLRSETGTSAGTKFVVDLQGLTLPTETAKRIESEIRQVVMSELAKVDTSGGRSISDMGDIIIKRNLFPGSTMGFVASFGEAR